METKTLKLTVLCRMSLMVLLNEHCKGRATDKKWRLATRIYNKIEVTDQEKEEKFQVVTLSGIFPDMKAIREAPEIEVSLTESEIERLMAILANAELKPVDGNTWYFALMEQLDPDFAEK